MRQPILPEKQGAGSFDLTAAETVVKHASIFPEHTTEELAAAKAFGRCSNPFEGSCALMNPVRLVSVLLDLLVETFLAPSA